MIFRCYGTQMDELTARLESLFRRNAAALSQRDVDGVQLAKQFYDETDLLIDRYGQAAIETVLDGPGRRGPQSRFIDA
jgi:hypothetical protein